jgi:hypothetical protein
MTAKIDPESGLAQFLMKDEDMQHAIQRREAQSQLAVAQLQARIGLRQLQANIALQTLAICDKAPVDEALIKRANEVLLASLSDEFYALPTESES